MKTLLLATTILALALSGHAYAKTPHRAITCTPGILGCPPVIPTPIPLPVPLPVVQPPVQVTPGSPAEVKGVIESLIEVQAQFVADVNTANARAINPWAPNPAPAGTPTPFDPIAAACYPTLATWAAGLALPSNPTPGSGGGLVTAFENLRIMNISAQGIIQQITNTGFPSPLVIACGGLITDTVTQEGKIAGEIASFDAMLAVFIPKPVLLKHNVGHLAKFSRVPDVRS